MSVMRSGLAQVTRWIRRATVDDAPTTFIIINVIEKDTGMPVLRNTLDIETAKQLRDALVRELRDD